MKKIQGLSSVYIILFVLLILTLMIVAYFLSEESALQKFMAIPLVSFIGWTVSMIAGGIAIFEFLAYKKLKQDCTMILNNNVRNNSVNDNAQYVETMRDMTI